MTQFSRGEVYDVMPDPTVGKEIRKKRRCVIVSSDVLNAHASLSIVCPLTEGLTLPPDVIHIAVPRGEGGTTRDSIILCDQVKAVDQDRLAEKRGNLSAATMKKIDRGLLTVLGF